MNNFFKAIIFAGVALGGIVVSTLIVNNFKVTEVIQTRPIIECPPTFEWLTKYGSKKLGGF
jgi:hypothetical protein